MGIHRYYLSSEDFIKYDQCSSFKNGLASFEIRGGKSLIIEGYINKKGEVVWQKDIPIGSNVLS